MTDHEHTEAVTECARYLAHTPPEQRPTPLVPALKQMFNLSSSEVCAAISESHLIRARAI